MTFFAPIFNPPKHLGLRIRLGQFLSRIQDQRIGVFPLDRCQMDGTLSVFSNPFAGQNILPLGGKACEHLRPGIIGSERTPGFPDFKRIADEPKRIVFPPEYFVIQIIRQPPVAITHLEADGRVETTAALDDRIPNPIPGKQFDIG